MLFIAFILQVVFFLLKVTGAVHWTWPVVLIPFWFILILAFLRLLVAVLDKLDELQRRRRYRKSIRNRQKQYAR